MEPTLKKIQEINGYLLGNAKLENDLGLMHGKLGLSIYFHQLARKTENKDFQKIAENLVEEISEKLGIAKLSMDFENGLAGISWGISYLVKSGFVEADLDDVLGELDDQIYRFLEDQKANLTSNFKNGLIGFLFYCLDRLDSALKSGHSSNIYIFQKLGSELLNQLGQLVEEERLREREPSLFSVFWDIPLTLIVLAKSKRLQVHPKKVDRILDCLNPYLNSLFPILHSNRLYLLLGIESVLKESENSDLRNHALFLERSIDMNVIYNFECKNLNVGIMDGVCGLGLIGKELEVLTAKNHFIPSYEMIFNKISNAVFWEDDNFYSSLRENIGLFSGLSGIGFTLLEFLELGEEFKSVKN